MQDNELCLFKQPRAGRSMDYRHEHDARASEGTEQDARASEVAELN
jgi:hypothetical protein